MNFGSFGLGSTGAQLESILSGVKQLPAVGPSQILSALDPQRLLRGSNGINKPQINAKANPYTRDRLQKLMLRDEPVLAYQWVGIIIDSNASAGGQLPSEFIDGITTPPIQVAPQVHNFNGAAKKTAGEFSVDSITLKLYTDIRARSFNYADQWMRATYRTDGFYNLPSKYKRDVQVYVLDNTGSTVTDMRFVGCFPTSYDSYDLNSEASLLETRLTLSVDECFFSFDTDPSAARDNISQQYNNSGAKYPGSRINDALSSMNIPGIRDRFGF